MEMKEPAGVACNPRISGIELITTDLARACAFYEQGLGFDRVSGARHDGAEIATRRLGKEMLHLVRPDCSGRTYPEPRAANDPWFQHFAIAVSDAAAAFERLSRGSSGCLFRRRPRFVEFEWLSFPSGLARNSSTRERVGSPCRSLRRMP